MSSSGGVRPDDPVAADEDPVVREYRYLLRTAAADALEAAHTEALAGPHHGDGSSRRRRGAPQPGRVPRGLRPGHGSIILPWGGAGAGS
jgi:hypothetical protein